jgi:hypothetical protein
MKKLWDILLFPPRLYERLTDNKVTLAIGVLLVGLVDFFLPDVMSTYKLYFTGKPDLSLRFNILMAILIILALSIIDTLFFSKPLFDLFNFFKKKEGLPHNVTLIKVIKAYILSHFIMVPVNTIAYFTLFRHLTKSSSVLLLNISVVIYLLLMIWGAAIVARGINSLFKFNPIIRRVTFIIVFVWNYILGVVLGLIGTWLYGILK